MIKAVFWDNDGILVDTEHLYFRATQQVLASVGVILDAATYRDLFLNNGSGAWHLAAQQGVSPDRCEDLREQRNDLYSQLLREETVVLEGVEAILKTLKPHVTMGVVTTSRQEHFDIIHATSGLKPYFDFILTRECYEHSKPSPEPYLKALETVGYRADECLVIEDSERGLRAAKAAGLTCWVIPNALTRAGDFSSADRILRHVSEVVTYLNDGRSASP